LEQFDHRPAWCLAHEIVSLRIVVVVMSLIGGRDAGVAPETPGFYGLDVALEFRVPFFAAYRQLRLGYFQSWPFEFPSAEGDGCQDE